MSGFHAPLLAALVTATAGCGMYAMTGASVTRGPLAMDNGAGQVVDLDGKASLDQRSLEFAGFTGGRGVTLIGGMKASYQQVSARTGGDIDGSWAASVLWMAGARVGPLVAGVSPYVQLGHPMFGASISERPLVERRIEGGAEICRWPFARTGRTGRDEIGTSGICLRLAVARDRGDPRELGDEITTATHYRATGIHLAIGVRYDIMAVLR